MKHELSSAQITQGQARWRKGIRHAMSAVSRLPQTRILHQEVEGSGEGVEKAKRLMEEGYGIIVVVPHDSFRDFLENMNFIFRHEGLGDKKIDIPLAKHQYDNPFFNLSAKLFRALIDVNQHPIVTERTKEKAVEKAVNESRIGKVINFLGPVRTPESAQDFSRKQAVSDAKAKIKEQEGKLMHKFFGEACNNLKSGGAVFMAPQATRSPELTVSKRTLGTFLITATENKGVDPEKTAILFLGHEIKGVTDYTQKDLRGFNMGRTFIMHPGPCYTLNEALVASGGIKTLDRWAVEDVLARLVSPHYLSEEIKQKLST